MRFIVTNNPLVRDKCGSYRIEYVEMSSLDVLIQVRDYIHKNCWLLSHPLTGGIKLGANPYKTVLMTDGDNLDIQSLNLIEESIAVYKKFSGRVIYPQHILDDMRELDYFLITAAFESNKI